MTPGLVFGTPLLLIGLVAAGIPPLLHLLSRARAKQVPFPTLRFLHLCMEKTARRRRLQHWLLMLLRCGLLALLAVGVAEPISRAAGAWLGGAGGAAAIVLDNSMSMSAGAGESTALASAKAQAAALLEGANRPGLAGVLTTNGGLVSSDLTTALDILREGVAKAPASLGRAPLAQRVQAAAAMLRWQAHGRKAVYAFSDLQQLSFKELSGLPGQEDYGDIDLYIVNTAPARAGNVAVSDLRITGQAVSGAVVTFWAEIASSGPAQRIVDVRFQADSERGEPAVRTARVSLASGGAEGSRATVRFQHRFDSPGLHTGTVTIQQDDDLSADNVRYFAVSVGDRLKAAVVEGVHSGSGADVLMLALDPFGGAGATWPIQPRVLGAQRLVPADLAGAPAVFFCNVPSFSPAQAAAVRQYVRAGGTATFFLGPDVQVDNYNQLLGSPAGDDAALLPATLSAAIGQIGPQAPATGVEDVDVEHPYLAGLYEQAADYKTVLVQRHFPLAVEPAPARVLMRLADGDALWVTKPYGRGAVVLCATSCGPQWSNLPLTGLFLPLVSRICLTSAAGGGAVPSYAPGAPVRIQPTRPEEAPAWPGDSVVQVTPPPSDDTPPAAVAIPLTGPGEAPEATFTATDRVGVYRWTASAGSPRADGAFVVNADGAESDLSPMDAKALTGALLKSGWRSVTVGGSLEGVRSAAAARAAGHNWWDLLVVLVIVLLVAEAVLANRVRVVVPAAAGSPVSTAPAGG